MKTLQQVWIISLIFKLLLAALIPLSADEAYYWVWSHNLRLSYFDHPPMVSWIFWLGHLLEPLGHSVRWPAVILGHGTLLIWLEILKPHVDLERMKYWLYLALFSPLVGFGSLIVTPDLPVIFFWSLSLLFLQRALSSKKGLDYVLLGFSLGLGFCAKYHIVLFVPFLFVYLLWDRRFKDVQWKWVLVTILVGLFCCLPVIVWNFQNEFASFTFQLRHGLESPEYHFSWTWSYVLGQILIIFPLIFYAALRSTPRLFVVFGWGPLIFFFLTSFKALVEANWPVIAYPAIFALAVFHPRILSWSRWYIGVWATLYLVVISVLFVPSLRSINSKISEPFHLQEISSLAQEYKPLYASTYQMASSLWYFSKTPVYKLSGMSRYDFFDTLNEGVPQGTNFYLLKQEGNSLPSWISDAKWAMKEVKKISPDFILLEFNKK